jgi:hypothetical protein
VGAAAGLNRAYLSRARQIADIENPQSAKAFVTDFISDPVKSAVDAAAGLLDGHDE